MLGISESMVWKLLADGSIARVKIGRRTLIRVAELDRFLTASERDNAPAATAEAPSESSSVVTFEEIAQ